ncbi:type II toxin-antitoxin system RelE/ParE family toxin [Ghiorsea bivora]|uniref:type II toxin-antitoxin system RelE/ParE family toxin n=1 Tax=Ghiorsea bivora TaxID=1485545 RepID=UPI00056EFB61|nr:type II toxin-antitoxin system RelE/ParE family toxin [Ghiorsea bivora]
MPQTYQLSPAADQDLVDIWTYSAQHWGKTQANQYLKDLESCFLSLVQTPTLGRQRPEIRQGYASINQHKHVIFYRIHHQTIEIIRIMHQRIDIMHHISDHLEDS